MAKAEAHITLSIDQIVLESLEDAGHHIEALETVVEAQQERLGALEGEVAELKARLGIVAELDQELLRRVALELARQAED